MSRSPQIPCVAVEFERHVCAHCGTFARDVTFCLVWREADAHEDVSRAQLNTESLFAELYSWKRLKSIAKDRITDD
jgi:hypothetical protein